jgi:hypothetical protein
MTKMTDIQTLFINRTIVYIILLNALVVADFALFL